MQRLLGIRFIASGLQRNRTKGAAFCTSLLFDDTQKQVFSYLNSSSGFANVYIFYVGNQNVCLPK